MVRNYFRDVSVIVLLFVLAGLSFSTWPLLDPTEARVVSIAQRILQVGEWYRLEAPIGSGYEPYLAKPPFHYWWIASCLKTGFPIELGTRLPGLLSLLVTLLATYLIGIRVATAEIAISAVTILATSVLFLFAMPTALIDAPLTAALTLALALGLYAVGESVLVRRLAMLFLLGAVLGFGVLEKGLVGLVLPGVSLFLAAALIVVATLVFQKPLGRRPTLYFTRDLIAVLFGLAVLVIPAYLQVEMHNPGFLRYFLIEEHFARYLSNSGNPLNGSFHRQIIGSSLVFFILGGLPWSLSLPIMLKRAKCEPWRYDLILLSAWAAAPSLFFFFARSHLPTYVLPGLPPLAVLIALQFGGVEKFLARHLKWIVLGFLSFPLLVWALDSHFEISIFAIAILTFAMSVFIMAPLLGRCDRERIVAPVRFFSVICACVVFIQPLMDDLSSTRDVFEDLVENGLQKGKVAYFPQDVPFSAYIYSPIPVYGEELTHLRILEERPRDVLVFTRKKNLHTMTRGEELAKGDLFTDGKWSVREFTAEEARF